MEAIMDRARPIAMPTPAPGPIGSTTMSNGLSGTELAEHILRKFFAANPDESVSRSNTINAIAGTGRAQLPYRRTCADAWQILQRAGLVCREPEPPREGDWWFLTNAGRSALSSGDIQGSIMIGLGAAP